jgi:hypothetical protein
MATPKTTTSPDGIEETRVERTQRVARNTPDFGENWNRMQEFAETSPQSQGVVSGASGNSVGINQQPSQAASIPPTQSVDTTAIGEAGSSNVGFPDQPSLSLAGPSPTIEMPEQAAGIATGVAPAPEAVNVAEAREAIQTRRGTIWATGEQRERALDIANSPRPQTYDERMAPMRQAGANISARLKEEQRERDEAQRMRYLAFRQSLEEKTAREAMSTEGGRTPQVSRGAQALAQAERWKQAQQGVSPIPIKGSGGNNNFGTNRFGQPLALFSSGSSSPASSSAISPFLQSNFTQPNFASASGPTPFQLTGGYQPTLFNPTF